MMMGLIRPPIAVRSSTRWAIEPARLLACRVGDILIEADTPGIVTWPHHPIAVYEVPARLPLEQAVLRVGIPISSEPRAVRLRLP